MPVTVIVGGQFGSEGKGKVTHYLAEKMAATYVIRVGGSNSGHTVVDDAGTTRIFRHLPTAAILPTPHLIIPAGSYLDLDVLFEEIERASISAKRLSISPQAVLITPQCKNAEKQSSLTQIGSTQSGTGAAVLARIQRSPKDVLFAKDCEALKPYVADIPSLLRSALAKHERVIIEGTQGFGLSLLHSSTYPYVTSRDTTAAAFVAEAGVSPLDVDDIVLVLRAYPIRVAGTSGPLPNETTWEVLSQQAHTSLEERTSVTKKIRRVAHFDADIVRQAISVNNPTRIVLNHVDYLHKDIRIDSPQLKEFILNIERQIEHPVNLIGLSPKDLYIF